MGLGPLFAIVEKENGGHMSKKIEELVTQIAQPIAENLGLLIYDVEFKKEGPDHFLRVFLDKLDGAISIDDCEAVSRPLSDELDRLDPIDVAYYLEVSSPGVERQLKKQQDVDRFQGSRMELKFFAPYLGTKKLVCILKGRNETDTTVILDSGEEVEIPNNKIASAKLVAEF